MSDIVAVQMIVSFSTLMAIVLTWLLNRKKMDAQNVKLDAQNVVLEQTHAAVNSNYQTLRTQLEATQAQVDRFTVIVHELKDELLRVTREGVVTPKRAATGVIVKDGEVSTASERHEDDKGA